MEKGETNFKLADEPADSDPVRLLDSHFEIGHISDAEKESLQDALEYTIKLLSRRARFARR